MLLGRIMREPASSKRFARKRIARSASAAGLTTESSSSDAFPSVTPAVAARRPFICCGTNPQTSAPLFCAPKTGIVFARISQREGAEVPLPERADDIGRHSMTVGSVRHGGAINTLGVAPRCCLRTRNKIVKAGHRRFHHGDASPEVRDFTGSARFRCPAEQTLRGSATRQAAGAACRVDYFYFGVVSSLSTLAPGTDVLSVP